MPVDSQIFATGMVQPKLPTLVGKLFACVNIYIKSKNISISDDIGRIILSANHSEFGTPKPFYFSLSPFKGKPE